MFRFLLTFALTPFFASCALAQETDGATQMKTIPAPIEAGAIALYDGVAPGSESATHTEIWTDIGTERWARNVTQPTLLPVLPDADIATGVAVIVVPGGGFQFVSIDNEGYRIADQLAAQGVAAFILKYRTMETPEAESAFAVHNEKLFAPDTPENERVDVTQGIPFAVADAMAAMRIVEARQAEWGVDKDRIGMLGFSAGAVTTLSMVLAGEDTPTPDFIGYIYGPMNTVDVPDNAPPMFAALAADDPLFGNQGFGIIEAWQSAGVPVELHYYDEGGHGFGAYKRGVTADGWFDQFIRWMAAQGLLQPPAED